MLIVASIIVASLTLGFVFGRFIQSKMLKSFGRDIPTILFDYSVVKRRAEEYLGKIEDVIKEREVWRELYNDQASGHDNAQALMMDVISQLANAYERETGKAPKLDPIIEMVRSDWQLKHGSEVREKLGEDGRQRKDSEETKKPH